MTLGFITPNSILSFMKENIALYYYITITYQLSFFIYSTYFIKTYYASGIVIDNGHLR